MKQKLTSLLLCVCMAFFGIISFETQTQAQTANVIISNVKVDPYYLLTNGARIIWDTNLPTDSDILYGSSASSIASLPFVRCDGTGLVTAHCVALSNLEPGATFFYKVRSVAAGLVGESQVNNFATRPIAPTNLTATVSSGSVTLTWTDNSSNEIGFKLYRRDSQGIHDLGNANASVTTFTDPTRLPAGTYYYKISSIAGISPNLAYSIISDEIIVTIGSTGEGTSTTTTTNNSNTTDTTTNTNSGTSGGSTVPGSGDSLTPNTPSGLTATVNSNIVTLTWTDNSTNETGFKVYRGPIWTDIGNVSPNTTTFVDSRQPGSYVYRVQAFNSVNGGYPLYSGVSNDVTVTVGSATTLPTTDQNTNTTDPTSTTATAPAPTGTPTGSAPAAPSGLVAKVTGNSVLLTWTDNSTNETGFKMYRGPIWTDIGNVAANVTSFTDSDLAAGTYTYRLQSFAGAVGSYFRYSPVSNYVTVTIAAKPTETQPVNAPVRILAVDAAGQALPGVFVTITGDVSPEGQKTDSFGLASFNLGAGSYVAQANIGSESGYINPPSQTLTISASEAQEIKFVFERRTAALLKLRGTVRLDNGSPVDALVWAWSDSGDSLTARAAADGSFTFMVKPGTDWHLNAAKESTADSYKASEATVSVGSTDATIGLTLMKIIAAPAPAIQTGTLGSALNAKTGDGPFVAVPPSQSSGGGSVTLEIKPTLEAPVQASKIPVSTVYDVTVTNNGTGQKITTFDSSVEIRIPYTESGIKGLGLEEKNLKPSYYDEQADTWVPIKDYTVDTDNNTVVAWVNHLTRFAIVMPADTTPPLPPSSVKGAALNTGAIYLTWKNPDKDFKYVKIYRSEKSGDKGTLIQNSLSSSSYVDAQVILGKTYYYQVKAVDPAGNESTNKDALSVKSYMGTQQAPDAVSVSSPLARDLKLGSKGADVTVLQNFLKSQGLFAAKSTSYFGAVTKSSVVKFQNKYADETWKADKLRAANGSVSGATRSKLNQLMTR